MAQNKIKQTLTWPSRERWTAAVAGTDAVPDGHRQGAERQRWTVALLGAWDHHRVQRTAQLNNIRPTATHARWTRTRNPKVIWEETRRHPSRQRITAPQSPHWLQWVRSTSA